MSAIDLAAGLVRQFEGCQLQAYADLAGVMTIGFGHTGKDVHEGLIWTQDRADAALSNDLQTAAMGLFPLVKTKLSEKQTAALISICFNLGAKALKQSQLIADVNAGRWIEAAHQFARWDHVGKEEVKGLLRRRFIEAALFLEGS